MLATLLFACAPVYRFPGPLGSLGQEPAPFVQPDERAVRRRSREPAVVPWEADGQVVAMAAAKFVGADCLMVDAERYRWDCSGLVEAAMASVGVSVKGSGADLLAQARDLGVTHRRRRPWPGDVAFFDNTWDRNDNGLLDDPLSHVGIVESVDTDGTITVIHLSSSAGVTRLYMNLGQPDVNQDENGKVLNSILRRKQKGDSLRTRYLAGELCFGFASFWRAADAVADEPQD